MGETEVASCLSLPFPVFLAKDPEADPGHRSNLKSIVLTLFQ